jgi:hypothetical protein
MLASDADEAVAWGTRAIELATRLGDSEALVHALNNVGTAEDAQGAAEGHAKVERSLQLALAHGYHERVARAYSTLISVRVTHREYAAAQRYIEPRPRTSRRATLIHGRATCSPRTQPRRGHVSAAPTSERLPCSTATRPACAKLWPSSNRWAPRRRPCYAASGCTRWVRAASSVGRGPRR